MILVLDHPLLNNLLWFFCLLQYKVAYLTSLFPSCEFKQIRNDMRLLK